VPDVDWMDGQSKGLVRNDIGVSVSYEGVEWQRSADKEDYRMIGAG
jgi:hypothetical protein